MEKLLLHTETGKENGIPRFIASYPIEGFLTFSSSCRSKLKDLI